MFKVFLGSQFLAIANMVYLSYIHYNLKFSISEKSLCNINDTFNCDIVNLSSYASLLGQPISLWGVFANLTLLFLGLSAYIEREDDKKHFIKFISVIFAGLIAATSIVFGIISFLLLETYCLFCIFAYILSFISLGAIITWKIDHPLQKTSYLITEVFNLKKHFQLFLPIFLIIPITLITDHIIKTNMAGQYLKQLDALFENWERGPHVEFQTNEALIYSPSQEPKMTILEFADFQCPACKNASGTFHNFIKSRNDVKLIFMFFPLDSACNEHAMRSSNGRPCWLAAATYCANRQDKGWPMHDKLFEMFYEVKRSDLAQIATDIGLDQQPFTECLDNSDTIEFIKSQARQGGEAKITGTPGVFINGKYLPAMPSWVILEKIYNSL